MTDGMGPTSGCGGPAAIARATLADRSRELEVSARYYDTDFVNPLARAMFRFPLAGRTSVTVTDLTEDANRIMTVMLE